MARKGGLNGKDGCRLLTGEVRLMTLFILVKVFSLQCSSGLRGENDTLLSVEEPMLRGSEIVTQGGPIASRFCTCLPAVTAS